MSEKRSRERVAEIDAFIKKYYQQYGLSYCAEKLGENRTYVMGRANYKKIRLNIKIDNVRPKSKKLTNTQIMNNLKQNNKTLRLENIKLIQRLRTMEAIS